MKVREGPTFGQHRFGEDSYVTLYMHWRATFGTPEFLLEITDHVTYLFENSQFWSTLKLFENPLLVQFDEMKVYQKRFIQPVTNMPKLSSYYFVSNIKSPFHEKSFEKNLNNFSLEINSVMYAFSNRRF